MKRNAYEYGEVKENLIDLGFSGARKIGRVSITGALAATALGFSNILSNYTTPFFNFVRDSFYSVISYIKQAPVTFVDILQRMPSTVSIISSIPLGGFSVGVLTAGIFSYAESLIDKDKGKDSSFIYNFVGWSARMLGFAIGSVIDFQQKTGLNKVNNFNDVYYNNHAINPNLPDGAQLASWSTFAYGSAGAFLADTAFKYGAKITGFEAWAKNHTLSNKARDVKDEVKERIFSRPLVDENPHRVDSLNQVTSPTSNSNPVPASNSRGASASDDATSFADKYQQQLLNTERKGSSIA